jgi:hypothetical protein
MPFGSGKTGMQMMLEQLVPKEIMEQIQKAAVDMPQAAQKLATEAEQINAKLAEMSATQFRIEGALDGLARRVALLSVKFDAMRDRLDPSAVPAETAASNLNDRVSNGEASASVIQLMTDTRLTSADLEALDRNPPKILAQEC